jgi:hypothetical protein
MESLDERVAYMEGRMEDHTALMADIRADMRELRSEIHRLDHKVDRHFMWLVGMLIGILTALGGLAFQLARLQPL